MQRVPVQKIYETFHRALLDTGFPPERAALCARIFSESTRDGVYSHGLNRFPSFVRSLREGGHGIDAHASPEKVGGTGALEQWDGRLGPGVLNAWACMERAVALAHEHGIGCVALRNTNHWMRAGTYGLQAADAGCIGICWTNTTQLIPPWGSAERKVGNNPLVFGIPRPGGHVLLDMAISQYSNGKLTLYRERGERLPVPGGYDGEGRLSYDAAAIQTSRRPMPIGHWKGVGLALVLDLVAALLSGGASTCRIAQQDNEYGVSQVFVALDVDSVVGADFRNRLLDEALADLQAAAPLEDGGRVTYPGQRMLETRRNNEENGVPVDPKYWQQVLEL